MKVTVVGAGIMGMSVAWALKRDGHQVSVYEQTEIPNPLGSSVDQHRLIRFPYGNELGYTRMVADAYWAWEQLWSDLGKQLYIQTGTLVLASAEQNWIRDSAINLQKLGISVQWLETQQLQRTFPLFRFDDVKSAFYLDSGGVLLAEQIILAMLQYLDKKGVKFHTYTPVREVDLENAQIVLENGLSVNADILVIAAGPWVERLLPDFNQRVTPSRQVIVYLRSPANKIGQWAKTPMVLDIDPECGFYLVPPVAGTNIKVGDHRFTLTGNPDCKRVAMEEEARIIYQLCQQRFADFDHYQLQNARTCFYTVAPQEHFIIESRGKSWLMSGFSGHGFKFGPLLGLGVAVAIAGCCTPEQISHWAAGNIT
ncbi:FAD-dependent oxidoreductase [Nostoc sp. CENA67]|uniref:FAD-dependent oxidoreductase n=1 Tax=Amazonocrinis nigriterrae CENA67 TaxID=2794033 RepID=A0A8J7HU06_9NOST|nr:FAD-dependent oxidoreductase [Amazonocrinis nigriterrae]MBH8564135.1 FAD-dependent oxidoreductase [Amazonocrinis nigriterrae CENA67]